MSLILGCNTNVQIGDLCHMFYVTMYSSKSTQGDDRCKLEFISNAIVSKIMRFQTNAMANGEEYTNDVPKFGEGLGRILSGIYSLTANDVMSTTMAHLIVSQGGTRFTFSHDFTDVIVDQIIAALRGEDVNYIIRCNQDKNSKKAAQLADSWANDYIHCSEILKHLSLYQFTEHFWKEYMTWKEIKL